MMMHYGLLLFVVFEYVRPGAFIPGLNILHLNSLIPLALIVGSLVKRGPTSHEDVFRDGSTRAVLSVLAMIMLSVLTAEVTMYAYNVFTMVVGYVFISWVVAKETTDLTRIKGLFNVLILVHIVLAVLTPQMFTSGARTYIQGATFLGDGNDYALSVNVVVPFCLFLLFEARKKLAKMVYAAVLLFLVLCIVLTQSRGGTIALALVAVYYWLKSDRKVVTAVCAVVAMGVIAVAAPPSYFDRMGTISNYEEDGSAQSRITSWKAGFRMALSNPILGVGAGQYPQSFTRFAPPEATRWTTAHSIWFLVMGEHGFTGLLLLLYLIIGNIRMNTRLIRELRARAPDRISEVRLLSSLNASVIAYAAAGAFLSALYYPHIFMLSGLLVAARRIVQIRAAATETAGPPAPARKAITYHWAMQPAFGRPASYRSRVK